MIVYRKRKLWLFCSSTFDNNDLPQIFKIIEIFLTKHRLLRNPHFVVLSDSPSSLRIPRSYTPQANDPPNVTDTLPSASLFSLFFRVAVFVQDLHLRGVVARPSTIRVLFLILTSTTARVRITRTWTLVNIRSLYLNRSCVVVGFAAARHSKRS